MAKSINDILQEADDLISKKVAAAAIVPTEDDVMKLASELRADPPAAEEMSDYTLSEKLAHAAALLDTLINFEELMKVAAFEEDARSKGISQEVIAEFFEKRAALQFRSVTELIPGFRG